MVPARCISLPLVAVCRYCACSLRPLNSCAHPFTCAGETDDERWPRLATSWLYAVGTWLCDRKQSGTSWKLGYHLFLLAFVHQRHITTLHGGWQKHLCIPCPSTHSFISLERKGTTFFFQTTTPGIQIRQLWNCKHCLKDRRPLSEPPFSYFGYLSKLFSHSGWRKCLFCRVVEFPRKLALKFWFLFWL